MTQPPSLSFPLDLGKIVGWPAGVEALADGAMRKYAAAWQNGHFKLAVIATLLAYRRDHPTLFETGGYEPLMAQGPNADQIVGFLRRNDRELVLTAVARYPARLACEGLAAESGIPLPNVLHKTCWRDIISGARHPPTCCLRPKDVLALLPAAVLVAEWTPSAPSVRRTQQQDDLDAARTYPLGYPSPSETGELALSRVEKTGLERPELC